MKVDERADGGTQGGIKMEGVYRFRWGTEKLLLIIIDVTPYLRHLRCAGNAQPAEKHEI